MRVFGAYRPAPDGAVIPARIEHSQGDARWRALGEVVVQNPRGYLSTLVRSPGPGLIRIAWRDPADGRLAPTRPLRVP